MFLMLLVRFITADAAHISAYKSQKAQPSGEEFQKHVGLASHTCISLKH